METTPLIPKPPKSTFFKWFRFRFWSSFVRKKQLKPRVIKLGLLAEGKFPPNKIRNQKYSIITFLPLVLYQQFKFFLNMYFLVMALSQFIPDIRIGYLYTYWAPLCFVISVTVFREAIDDIGRYRRDRSVNSEKYDRLIMEGPCKGRTECVTSSSLRVGDIIVLHRGQRAPADLLLLRASDSSDSIFIATDQLDGETDWKVRLAVGTTQKLTSDDSLFEMDVMIFAEKPQPDIHSFIGTWRDNTAEHVIDLDVQNTIWSGCVLESAHATGMILYTGSETRSVMNNSTPRSKVGHLDLKVNNMTKVLFVTVILLSLLMITLKGFHGPWFRYLCRFILLFSYIIPISLRVNLEVGKTFYAWAIKRDKKIEGTVMRTTTIPEEMGRISYLLTDKTGTVTKNEMVFKKLSISGITYDESTFHNVQAALTSYVTRETPSLPTTPNSSFVVSPFVLDTETQSKSNLSISPRHMWDTVLAMALCHNVTPVYDKDSVNAGNSWRDTDTESSMMSESRGGAVPQQQLCDYQAASPDEVALVKWTDNMGVSLYHRDLRSISLKIRATNEIIKFNILHMFPFTSDTKCMGIIVQDDETSEITFYLKGADIVLSPLVGNSNWLKNQSSQFACEGLRTLVFAKKRLTIEEYEAFKTDYNSALNSLYGKNESVEHCIANLQKGLHLLSVTGVEDRLADDAPLTISLLSNAGIKIWMLTGDKLETALCIAKSLRLVNPGTGSGDGQVFIFRQCYSRVEINTELQRLKNEGAGVSLLISGDSLDLCLKWYYGDMALLSLVCKSVVVARCSPTQKARVVQLLRHHAKGSICAVGDGGNDVPMIQQADIGIGLEGKEGRAAALAGDVSAREFRCLGRLLLVHGRRSRLRSSTLSLFVVHRGLIISTMQAIFSTVFYLSSVSLYQGFLMVGYGTVFTSIPVFSLVLDKDIRSKELMLYPELYRGLIKGRDLSYKMFFLWLLISVYQGGIIMYGALIMFEESFIHIVAISFSALICTELIMVALTIQTWHIFIIMAEVFSFIVYILALIIFHEYFDAEFIKTVNFMWKVLVITIVACLPLYIFKYIHHRLKIRAKKRMR